MQRFTAARATQSCIRALRRAGYRRPRFDCAVGNCQRCARFKAVRNWYCRVLQVASAERCFSSSTSSLAHPQPVWTRGGLVHSRLRLYDDHTLTHASGSLLMTSCSRAASVSVVAGRLFLALCKGIEHLGALKGTRDRNQSDKRG